MSMNQEQAFVQAICEDPDDDAVRLIYADWLDEHGQPERAEFIRVQVELARLPRWHRRWQECLAHQRHLLVGDATGLPVIEHLGWGQFGRGFVEGVWTTSVKAFLRHAETIFAAAPVRHFALDLGRAIHTGRGSVALSVAPLMDSPWLSRLHSIENRGFALMAQEIERLGNSPYAGSLRSLTFRQGGILADGVGALRASAVFPRLTTLNLSENRGGVEGNMLRALADALAGVSEPVRLSTLHLTSAGLDDNAVAAMARSRVVANVTELDLYDNPVQTAAYEALAGSPLLGRLQVLRAGKTVPGVAGVEALAASPYLTDLRWLDLRNNALDAAAARVLAGAEKLNRLAILELRNNPLGDEGVCALTASRYLTSLVKLDLAGCKIGDRGGCALLGWPALADVVCLDLGRNAFGASVKQALRERFGNRVEL
jgi:uncharacterized protein (TIGR02996 family)